jgi:hypothetical protein
MRFKMFGWNPAPYFAFSILQNILVGLLVFLLARQLFHRTRVAFFAGLIATIAFPPIQVVTWIVGSTVSLLACFYLAAIILFIQNRRLFWALVPPALLIACVYTAVYWNHSGTLAEPVKALKSVIAPNQVDYADQSSNLYRLMENVNLSYTIHHSPILGVGWRTWSKGAARCRWTST